MTDILLDWLNKEVNLSKPIKNIAEDFASGYFFGELLHKFKEISNFNEYENKSDQETRIKNLKLVEKAFRDLEIKIDKERIIDISDGKKGVAARFLFQIKMKLSKKEIDFDNLMMKNSSQLYDLYKSIQYPNQNDKYLVDAKNRSSNIGNMQPKNGVLDGLKTLGQPDSRNELQIFEEITKDEESFKREKHSKMSNIFNAEKHYRSQKLSKYKNEYDTWQASIKHKKEFEAKQEEYLMKDAVKYRNAALQSIKKSEANSEIQIDSFDKTLEKLGLDIAVIDPKLKKPNNKNLMSSELILQKIRDKLAMDQAAKKERERRKRKINVDQTKAQIEIEKKKDETRRSLIMSNTELKVDLFSSVHEKRLEYENWRNLHSLDEKAGKKREKLQRLIRDETANDRNYDSFGIFDQGSTVFDKEAYFENLKKENLAYRTVALEKKKIKREKNIITSSNVLKQILDIVDECYNYQKVKSEEYIDVSEWKNWMQSFIVDGSLISHRSNSEIGFHEVTNKDLVKKQTLDYDSVPKIAGSQNYQIFSEYEEMELFNYIYFKGRWSKNLVQDSIFSKTVKVRDVLDIDYLYKLYGNKTKSTYRNLSDKAFNIELRDEDIETLTIPKENVKNYLFGEIIDIVTEIKFSFSENPHKISTNAQGTSSLFSYIPFKLSLIGHSFSGKTTQAKLLSENYSNIKVYDVESLIKKSIETLERLEIPLEANSKYKAFKKNQLEQLEKEREIEVEKFKEIKKYITPIRDALKQNQAVNDEFIVNLVLEFLRHDFPEKDPLQVTDEIFKKHKKKKEIMEELAKIKEEQIKKPKLKVKEEQQLASELQKINMDSNRGFVFIDFPKNMEQAKILENKFTGHMQEIDKPKTELQEYRDNYSFLFDRTTRPNPQLQIRESGLDIIVCLDVNSKECIRRSIGRRIDPSSGIIYHMEDNPAPVNDNKLRDRLQLVDDGNSEQQMKIKHLEFDNNIGRIKEFYGLFGNQKYNLKSFLEINGNNQRTNIHGEIMEYITRLKKISEDKENEILQYAKIDKNVGYLGNLESTQNVLNINTPKSNTGQAGNLSVISNYQPLLPANIQSDAKDLDGINQAEDDEFNKFSKKVDDARRKLNLNTIETIFFNWNKIIENYTSEAKNVFRNIKKQKDVNLATFSKFQVKFLNFLKRPSKKLIEVAKYQTKYNNFGEEYSRLREDSQVKQEFHKDVTELTEKIWEIIETRKNEAIEERMKVMNSGKIEKEMEIFFLNLKTLFFIEIEKFVGSIQIIRDFYVPQELPRNFNQSDLASLTNLLNHIKISDFIPDTIISIPLEGVIEAENSPRIEKLFHNCLKLIFVLDERLQTIDKNIKSIFQGTSSPDIQSIVKRNLRLMTVKKSQIDSSFFENKIEISYDDEMKNAIKIEKNKFKFRITLITEWGINYLKTMRKMATSLYNSFDDWIIDTVKSENEAMNNLITTLRSHIEKESPRIKMDKKELDGFDIYTMQDIMGYVTFGKQSMETSSVIDLERFRDIYNHVKVFELQKNMIRTATFMDVFVIKYLVDSDSDSEGIYPTIRNLTFHNYFRFIKSFEVTKNNTKSNSSKLRPNPVYLE